MTDTHTHIYMDAFAADSDDAVGRALASGVTHLILPGVDMATMSDMLDLHRRHQGVTSVAIGLHPTELGHDWRRDLESLEPLISSVPAVAIGETGIDMHWDTTALETQKEAFGAQIDLALKYDLPVIIHSRDALEETLEVIEDRRQVHGGKLPPLIFHSFTMGPSEVRRIREICDPWFGINGVVTFKNATPIREALHEIGIDRLLLETDSPYLAPVPHRGTRNESRHIPLIAAAIATQLGLSLQEVEERTDANAHGLFRLAS